MTTRDPRLATTAWRNTRLYILDRDRHLCQIMGPGCNRYATCVDHIVDRADGGAMYDPANLRAACRNCNGWRAATRTNTNRRAGRYRTTSAVYQTRF
jgi:5-methylcytosine-specific restriction protein A